MEIRLSQQKPTIQLWHFHFTPNLFKIQFLPLQPFYVYVSQMASSYIEVFLSKSCIVCLKYLSGYFKPWAGNLKEEKCRAFNEITGMAILVPILC
jgi:hypothetical protein